jgi:hypothetical protein
MIPLSVHRTSQTACVSFREALNMLLPDCHYLGSASVIFRYKKDSLYFPEKLGREEAASKN